MNGLGISLVESTSYVNCRGNILGGVVRYYVDSEVKSSLFDCCRVNGTGGPPEGGAIHVEGKNLSISDSTFSGCTSIGGGGAISFSGNILLIENCAFLFCESYDTVNNSAVGGGVRMYNTGGTFNNCSFLNCRSGVNGGAIGQTDAKDVEVPLILNNCTFGSNYASVRGGSVYVNRTTVQCTGCSFFHGNAAGGSGGALFVRNSTFTDVVFVRNIQGKCGGSVYVNSASSLFQDCTFIQNVIVNPECDRSFYCCLYLLCFCFFRFHN
jgi:hypothetical protein